MVALTIPLLEGGYQPGVAIAAATRSGLPEMLDMLAPGRLGRSAVVAAVLESVVESIDRSLAAHAAVEGALLSELNRDESLVPPPLDGAHRQLCGALQVAVLCEETQTSLAAYCTQPVVEGAFEVDGLDALLSEVRPDELACRVLRMAAAYIDRHRERIESAEEPPAAVATTLSAALALIHRTVVEFSRLGRLRALADALERRTVRIGAHVYAGLTRQGSEEPSGLLPVQPEEIVGNEDYLTAALRLARDVAGFDLESGYNPKRINPVIFGLGAPGCGKTITAHAVGNYFLDYCRERQVPARFLVVRRSDWASSYQNASAANLIRIFREEVFGFEGVCGVYWPDIDTALASRETPGLRSEEKQNLGAVFGVFDGTLLPNNGKWFMICDANTMHMDEAAVSRIAQNPISVEGPTSAAHYIRLMRDLMLRDVANRLPTDENVWERIGKLAASHRLSGRNVSHICGNIRAHVQDFEYPMEYFRAAAKERQEIIAKLSRQVDEAFLKKSIEDWVAFQRESVRREEEARFARDVEAAVRQMNASRAAVDRLGLDVGGLRND